MTRSSIVGPIILILIGGLFLANNLRPDIPMLEFLGRFWPFMLIAWGAVRLIEILIWTVRGKPLPVNGISGGEWFLVIFLSLIGTGLYALPYQRWLAADQNSHARHRDVRRSLRLHDRREKDSDWQEPPCNP